MCTTINLLQFLKYLAESLDILKTQEIMNVKLFRPPNSYILHYHGECGLFTLYLKRNSIENPKMENIEFYTCTL